MMKVVKIEKKEATKEKPFPKVMKYVDRMGDIEYAYFYRKCVAIYIERPKMYGYENGMIITDMCMANWKDTEDKITVEFGG